MSEIGRFCEIALATNLEQSCSRYSDFKQTFWWVENTWDIKSVTDVLIIPESRLQGPVTIGPSTICMDNMSSIFSV